ncbi:MAG: hypothetical protein U0270_35280 [Labilithrix sp.]
MLARSSPCVDAELRGFHTQKLDQPQQLRECRRRRSATRSWHFDKFIPVDASIAHQPESRWGRCRLDRSAIDRDRRQRYGFGETTMRIRAGVYVRAVDAIVCERRLDARADIRIGREEDGAELFCTAWEGPPQLLISGHGMLHLSPGMRVNMCGDDGDRRIAGTFEELSASGLSMPLPILERRMNIRVREGISVLTQHVND